MPSIPNGDINPELLVLTAEDIRVGLTYRAKRPQKQYGEVVDDRYVLYVSPDRQIVQYDSQTVRNGRHYPKVSMERFLRWARCEVAASPENDLPMSQRLR